MSFCTSFSSKRRPISRLTAYSVFFGFVTACRFADAPTRISPSSWYATIDGVVRPPSLFSMTLIWPPSMTATHELVVPRSMPMIFAMLVPSVFRCSLRCSVQLPAANVRRLWTSSSLRDRHQRRSQHAVGDGPALLQHRYHVVGRDALGGRHQRDRLVPVRVELLTDRVDFLQIAFLERRLQLLQRQF